MDKFYIYKGKTPVSIVDNADQMGIDQINRLSDILTERGHTIYMQPLSPYDFNFDEITGQKLNRIETFIYPEFQGKE